MDFIALFDSVHVALESEFFPLSNDADFEDKRETSIFYEDPLDQWLKLDLEEKKIVQSQPINWDEMMEREKERPKKAKVLHSTKLTNAGEIVVECAIPMVDKDREDIQITDYQLGTVNLGRPMRNQQMNLIDIIASSTKSRMIKDK